MFLYLLSLLATQEKTFDVGMIDEKINLVQYLNDTQVENNPIYQLASDDISDIETEMKKTFQEELQKRNLVCKKQESGLLFKITIERDYDPIKTYNSLQDRFVANNDGMSRIQEINCNVYKEKYMKICSDLVSAINVLHSYCKNNRQKVSIGSEDYEKTMYGNIKLYNEIVTAINFFLYCRKDIYTKGILLYPTSIDVSKHGDFELKLFYENKIIEDVDFSSFGDLKDFIVKRIDDYKYNEKIVIDDYIKSKTKQQTDNVELRKNIKKAFELIQRCINANCKFKCDHLQHFSCNQTNIKLYDITEKDGKNLAAVGLTDSENISEFNAILSFNDYAVDHVILPGIDYLERYKTLCTSYAELHLFCHQLATIYTYFETAARLYIKNKTLYEYLEVNKDDENYDIGSIRQIVKDTTNLDMRSIELTEKLNTSIKEYNEKTVTYEDFEKELGIIQKLEIDYLEEDFNAIKQMIAKHFATREEIERNEMDKRQKLVNVGKVCQQQIDKMQEINNKCKELINKPLYESKVEQYNNLIGKSKKSNPNKDLDYYKKDKIMTPIMYFTADYNTLVNYMDEMKEVAKLLKKSISDCQQIIC